MYLGQIEAASKAISETVWVAMIASHEHLSPVPPRKGINPFTRQPHEFKAPPTSAIVSIDGVKVGLISWAQDGSSMLIVDAEDGCEDSVAGIAEGVAAALDARFVRAAGGK
jgi:hypothetical protein